MIYKDDCAYIEAVPEEMRNLNKLRLCSIQKTYHHSGSTVQAVKGIYMGASKVPALVT